LTFKQANELGGSVRWGEQSTLIIFWKIDQKEGAAQKSGGEVIQHRFWLRYYRAFNLEQCDLPPGVIDKLPKAETHEHNPIDEAELIVANMPQCPELETAGSKAFYSSLTDRVTMPARELFTTAEEYYATFLHELTHYADFLIMPCFLRDQCISWGTGSRCRHNQSLSRNAIRSSLGRYRPGEAVTGWVFAIAFSFNSISA
jgi:antirestriction protein ArdC